MAKPALIVAILLLGATGGYFVATHPLLFGGYEYDWQKTCDTKCAELVGIHEMDKIDASDCESLNAVLSVGIQLDRSMAKAIDDKRVSLKCAPPPPPKTDKEAMNDMLKMINNVKPL